MELSPYVASTECFCLKEVFFILKDTNDNALYQTPFSRAYWRDAAAQLFNLRILCITAILIALRVAVKSAFIPVGQDLSITFGFFVNALGASVFGPVVAVLAAAITDTLGCIIAPVGPYFFPFIFVEISGSLIFALFLWRTKLSAMRIILSRFSVSVVCNLILNSSIMIWYYDWLGNGTSYAFMTVPRVVKNLALFPFEAFLLVVFFGAIIPVMVRLKLYSKTQVKPKLTKSHIILLAILLLIAIIIVFMYYSLWLPTQPLSVSKTENDIKVTLKSQMEYYRLASMDEAAPFEFTATVKNVGKTDIEALHEGQLCDFKLILPGGNVELLPLEGDSASTSTTIAAGKSVKFIETFADANLSVDKIVKGDYTVVATFKAEIDGQTVEIPVEMNIKVK